MTIDAAGTQKTIAEKIRSKRADYVLAGKGNQGTLLAELKKYFGDVELRKKVEESGGYKKTQEKARSQIEPREYYQTSDVKRLSQYKKWKGLKSIAMERKTLNKVGKVTHKTRYFISSLQLDIDTLS